MAGYLGSWPRPAEGNAATDFRAREVRDVRTIVIGDDWAQIPNDSAIDFGGIGKGFLLDKIGARLDKANVNNYWLSLGGDILCDGHDVDGKLWRVGVQSAGDPNAQVGTITNGSGTKRGIATSGTTKRRGTHAGASWHHLIDPRTQAPAETDVLTASVACSTATEADVYAKCLVIIGSNKAMAFSKKTSDILSVVLQASAHDPSKAVMLFGEVT
jgi:thiamine biosynthesis lipoprotein